MVKRSAASDARQHRLYEGNAVYIGVGTVVVILVIILIVVLLRRR